MEIVKDLQEQIASYYDNIIAIIPKAAVALLVALVMYAMLRIIRTKLVKFINTKATDRLLVNFLDGVIQTINIIIAILIFLYVVGLGGIVGTFLGAATISSVVIGFAFKDIAENFLAGVIMAFNRPFRIGDTVMTGSVEGSIVAMSLRDTHIKTFDGKDVFVPNGQIIKNPLFNYTIDGFLRGNFTIGVDYGTDVEKARTIILNAVRNIPGVLIDEKAPRTHVKNLNTSTVDIEVHYWIDTFDKKHSGLEIKSMAQAQVVKALTDSQVIMPADIIELKNYDEALRTNSNLAETKTA